MKKIHLFCAGGLSTTLLLNKIRSLIETQRLELEIEAYPSIELEQHTPDCDLVILGPQVAGSLKDIQNKFPNQNIMVCDMAAFSNIDGQKILTAALKKMGL